MPPIDPTDAAIVAATEPDVLPPFDNQYELPQNHLNPGGQLDPTRNPTMRQIAERAASGEVVTVVPCL